MSNLKERTTIAVKSERAVLAAVRLPDDAYDARNPFAELASLAEQAGAVVVGELEQHRQTPDPATLMGKGKVEELKAVCDTLNASLVVFDHDLSPRQLSNIEQVVGRKIVDRSELILDIFASRATTHEAKLQVELAQLEYTYPRLRAMWTHLERIVGHGGIGGIGTRGPGEQQLEIDRRIVQKKKVDLRRELDSIHNRKRRAVTQRKQEFFTVGLVGYTNAGKSTLFNTLTAGGAYADNRLFATLMTRTREWDLRGGLRAMLSDTVGFVRDIPPHLIASFRATLEEATHADLLLIVLDVSDPAAEIHFNTVSQTLDDLETDVARADSRAADDDLPRFTPPQRLLLLNKVDQLADNREVLVWRRRFPDAIPISAKNPDDPGLAELARVVADAVQRTVHEVLLSLPTSDSRAVALVENRAQVLDRQYADSVVTLRVRIGERQLDQLRSMGARFSLAPVPPDADTSLFHRAAQLPPHILAPQREPWKPSPGAD